jgi:3',5'-cyclic AMP phosphodiesterase CpdA
MVSMQPHLTFVQISDTHIGASAAYRYHGLDPARHLEQAVAAINAFAQPPAFVLHTGDLSTDRSPESYALAARLLGALRVPLYVVMGNHDDRALLRRHFDVPPSRLPGAGAPLDYTFEVQGEWFVVLDGWDPDVADPLGKLSAEQLSWLGEQAAPDGPPLTVAIHYPLLEMGSPWLDAHMILTNGAALHEALLPARQRLRAVLGGHLHRPSQIVREGITYLSGPSTVLHYAWTPWESLPTVDAETAPGYNLLQYFDGYTVARVQSFARPA